MSLNAWKLKISSTAAKDYQAILDWTRVRFGVRQTGVYAKVVESAFHELYQGPDVAGVKWRPELGPGIASLHVARNGFKGRHLVIFRVAAEQDNAVIEVLRLLHDSMDLQRHQLFTDAD
jgi:toxin ParE1/3/4